MNKPIFLSKAICDELGIAYNSHDLEYTEVLGMCLRITEEELEDEGLCKKEGFFKFDHG